jgi:hypothetical protein
MGPHPGMFSTGVDLTALLKGYRCDRVRSRSLGPIEHLDKLGDEQKARSWNTFNKWLHNNKFLKNRLCSDCPKHLQAWIGMAKCFGAPAPTLLALNARLKKVLGVEGATGST